MNINKNKKREMYKKYIKNRYYMYIYIYIIHCFLIFVGYMTQAPAPGRLVLMDHLSDCSLWALAKAREAPL